MKKMDKRWTIRLSALALSAVLLGTVAALATGGDQTDPLITLSYLNQTAIPQIVQQIEEKTGLRQKELEQAFANQINQYLQQSGQRNDLRQPGLLHPGNPAERPDDVLGRGLRASAPHWNRYGPIQYCSRPD